MSELFLYFAGHRLSETELSAARLDGDLVEVGEAFMPADAVETAELRAASLRPLLGATAAATRRTAAWVHGAVGEPPARHTVQRISATRRHHVAGPRVTYSDQLLGADQVMRMGPVAVTILERTLTDLLRDAHIGDDEAAACADAIIAWRPSLVPATLAWLTDAPPVHFKRAVQQRLRARQDEVTR
jgi:hypothetical protein